MCFTGQAFKAPRLERQPLPALPARGTVRRLYRCYEWSGRPLVLFEHQYREQFAHGIFPNLSLFLPVGGNARMPAQFCGTTGPQTGSWRCTYVFTDGSSWSSGAVRRAGRAVVAVGDWGNLKSAACGAVPIDVLP